MFFLHVYIQITCVPGAHGGQEEALNLWELDGYEVVHWSWELSLGPLQEKQALVTTKISPVKYH